LVSILSSPSASLSSSILSKTIPNQDICCASFPQELMVFRSLVWVVVTTFPHKEFFLEIRVLVKEVLSWNRDEQAWIIEATWTRNNKKNDLKLELVKVHG
jgi:hypothetical protein